MSTKNSRRKPPSVPAETQNAPLCRVALRLAIGVRLVIHERLFVITAIDVPGGTLCLTSMTGPETLKVTVSELAALGVKGDTHEQGHARYTTKRLPYLGERELDKAQKKQVELRTHYTMCLHRLGVCSYKNPIFVQTLKALASARGDDSPPAPTTVYDWIRAFRKHGCDAQVFRRMQVLKRKRGPKNPELAAIIDGAILDAHRGTKGTPTLEEIQKIVNERYTDLKRAQTHKPRPRELA